MDTVWYLGYEEDSELQTLHPEGSSVCLDFTERAGRRLRVIVL